jgi:hypothetical protein
MIENSVISWADVLRACRSEGASDLPNQSTAHPQPACLIEKICHLRRQATKPGADNNNGGVVVRQFFNCCHRCWLVKFIL